ncbi:hypothetical protein DRI50_03860 [candidate division KSB1 bacterium]|nr:MAG: hypothetical protein DRI50_03860 [candidate division KSB1 bacterium]
MEEQFRQKLRNLYRVNRILWYAVLLGILILMAVGYVLHATNAITPQTVGHRGDNVSTVFLIIALILLYIVFHMKRTYLTPKKLIWRARRKKVDLTGPDVVDFIAEFGERADVLVKTLMLLRRYYMVIWSIANLITLLGFVEFVISGQFRVLATYGIVALYSLLINYPSFKLIERCYNVLELEDLGSA